MKSLNLASRIIPAILCLLLSSCSEPAAEPSFSRLQTGEWKIVFDIGKTLIPVRLEVCSPDRWQIHNDGETIALEGLSFNADSFHVKLPLFQTYLHGRIENDSTLSGYLHDPTRSADYTIPFTVRLNHEVLPPTANAPTLTYDCTFSPADSSEMYKALGMFRRNGDAIAGTFLTETGDYRFLSGRVVRDSLQLSCFDGAHLFGFNALLRGDSIVSGTFYSGKHWNEPWEGVLSPDAALRDPESLTQLKSGTGDFSFQVQSLDGDTVHFGSDSLAHRVSLIQIMGSWCPNCTDESKLLKQLYAAHSNQGLRIIPVAFERSEDRAESARILRAQWDELSIPYPVYLGAGKGKGKAEQTFPMLNHVMSFPTCIFVDKKGQVRKIHTGFYGPGTGDYYDHYVERLEMFVQKLLREPS